MAVAHTLGCGQLRLGVWITDDGGREIRASLEVWMRPATAADVNRGAMAACALNDAFEILESAGVNHSADIHCRLETIVWLRQCRTQTQLFGAFNDQAVNLVILRGMDNKSLDANAVLPCVLAARRSAMTASPNEARGLQ